MYRASTALRALLFLMFGWCLGIMCMFFMINSYDTSLAVDNPDYTKDRAAAVAVRSIDVPPVKPPACVCKGDKTSNVDMDTGKPTPEKDEATVELHKDKGIQEQATKDFKMSNVKNYLESDVRKDLRTSLETIKSKLASAYRLSYSGKAKLPMKESYNLIENMLSKFDPLHGSDDKLVRNGTKMPVCPEFFKGFTHGFPYFYNVFDITNCSDVAPFKTALTIILDFHEEPKNKQTAGKIERILSNIHKYYNEVPVVIATDGKLNIVYPAHVQVVETESSQPTGKVWTELINRANTEYVFIGRDLDYFDWNSRLERLVREVFYLEVPVAGSSVRIENGHWSTGCQQVVYRNYTLSYREGYDISQHGCVYCSYVRGPFVALKSTLLDNKLNPELGTHDVFEDFFMRLHQKESLSVVCPDAMNYIRDNTHQQNDKHNWLSLAKKYGLNRIHLASGTIHKFTCNEVGTQGKMKGVALPPCTLQALSDAVKFFMSTCEQENIICELQGGTLLGAVKFNKILPWERDADLTFLTQNYTTLQKLADKFRKNGYGLKDHGALWCCADGRQAGGKFHMSVSGWDIQIYGQHIMDTEKLANVSLPPTKVMLDGMWVSTPRNPALFVRNRYGREDFRHAQHWMTTGMKDGWGNYNTADFTPCQHKGSHACLDQYLSDGNLQFDFPMP